MSRLPPDSASAALAPGRGAARHYGMDWLRIGAFGLLIAYHVGLVFVPGRWHVKAQPMLDWVALPMHFIHGWWLSLLFLVSGYASAAILELRPGVGAFLGDRSVRLLVPLLFGIVVVIPPQPWIELVLKHNYADGFFHFWARDYFRFGTIEGIIVPTWLHLWFVAYLWLYTMLLGALLWLLPDGAKRALGRLAMGALGNPAGLALLPLGWLLLKSLVIWPLAPMRYDLVGDLPAHAVYFPMLAFGFALRRHPAIWRPVRRLWQPALAISLVAYIGIAGIELAWPSKAWPANTSLPEALNPVFAALKEIQGWGMIIASLGLADRFLDRDAPGRAMLNEAVFPFYLVHQTIIVVVAGWCLLAGLDNGPTFGLILAATVLGCWVFYRIGREIPGLRALIGLRGWRARRRRPPQAVPVIGG